MTSIYLSLTQGIISGGASSYLSYRSKQNGTDLWGCVALEIHHLLLLTAETIHSAAIPLGGIAQVVKGSYMLMPLVLCASLFQKRVTPLEKTLAKEINALYRVSVIAASLATYALGNHAFALGSLSMIALDVLAREKMVRAILTTVHVCAAILAAIGYTAQVFMAHGSVALVSKISTAITWVWLSLHEWVSSYWQDMQELAVDINYNPFLKYQYLKSFLPYSTNRTRIEQKAKNFLQDYDPGLRRYYWKSFSL